MTAGNGGAPTVKAPRHYTREARRLYEAIAHEWRLDAPALALLDQACTALMRAREAQALLAKEGLVLIDDKKKARADPAATIERDAQMTFLRNLKALSLDLEVIHAGLGRPPSNRPM